MRVLRYSINVTLDGCVDHEAVSPDPEMHQYHADNVARADALLLGRVTYGMMESAWRKVAETGQRAEWMEPWMESFAHAIHAVKKYVVSRTLPRVDWHNAELVRGDLPSFVQQLKQQPGKEVAVGGVKFPLALANLGLIDEYEFMVHPRMVGHGPWLFAGLAQPIDVKLVDRHELKSGALVLRYAVKR